MSDYLVNFSAGDLQLVQDALSFYSQQTTLFGRRAEWAAVIEEELDSLKTRQDSPPTTGGNK
jgi:hypothetical protein